MSEPLTDPAKGAERAQAQRERILCAAQRCFVDHGFHAASMGDIAKTAGMSPGLIYRYYDSKSTIILAIIERQLVEARDNIRALSVRAGMAEALFETFIHWRDKDPRTMNAALFAEMSAEATRSPVLAAALQASDLVLRDEMGKVFSAAVAQRGGKALPPEMAQSRALALQCFVEGMAIRAVREPGIDPQLMKSTIAAFVDRLLAPPD